jgi:hypothetical protein
MRSLYEKNPENWDKLARFGHPEFRELAKRFSRYSELDQALSSEGKKVSSGWGGGRYMPSVNSIVAARNLLEKIQGKQMNKNTPDLWTANNRVEAKEIPVPPEAKQMVLVAGPEASLKKLENIAKMLGCEVVDV